MRTLLAAVAVLALSAPVVAQTDHHRADGGVFNLPNLDPDTLTANDVDVLIWPIVQQVNRSGWVWTTESCQGHDENGPLLGLVTDDIGRALALLSDAVLADALAQRDEDNQDPKTALDVRLQWFVRPRIARGRYQVRVMLSGRDRARALAVFARFAESTRNN